MLQSISVLGKSIIFATILSLVNITVSYIYTRTDCNTQINTVASYLKNVATSGNKEFTQSFGNDTANNLELLAFKVSIDGASVTLLMVVIKVLSTKSFSQPQVKFPNQTFALALRSTPKAPLLVS